MKRKNLFIANTYFQLITAINMSLHNLKDCSNDLVLTDISVNTEKIVEKLTKQKVFDNIYFIEYQKLHMGNRLKKYIIYLFKRQQILKGKLSAIKYDELFFYNLNILTYSIVDELHKYNKNLVCSLYDEGIGTYTITHKNNKINNLLRTIFLRPNIDKLIKKIYLYHPNLLCYQCNQELVEISRLDRNDKKLKNILNTIFDYECKNDVPQKYIFFEEAFFCDNKDINDLELITEIASIVGKENLIVKLHPRNKINRFEKLGISTWKNSGISWEVIQMNENYSDKVFLSISSGTILMSKLFFKEQIKSYYLFNCTNHMSDLVNDNFHKYLEKIDKTIGLNNLIIPKSKEEFIELLKKEKETNGNEKN